MDDLEYEYTPGTNRLRRIDELQTNVNRYEIDLDPSAGNTNGDWYVYDDIGQIIEDHSNAPHT